MVDAATMNSVLKSANIIYHNKRFLFERDHRIELLESLKSEGIQETEAVVEEIIEDEKNK